MNLPSNSASLLSTKGERRCTTLSRSPCQSSGETAATHFTRMEPPRKWRLLRMNRSPKVLETRLCRWITGGYLTNASVLTTFDKWNSSIYYDNLSTHHTTRGVIPQGLGGAEILAQFGVGPSQELCRLVQLYTSNLGSKTQQCTVGYIIEEHQQNLRWTFEGKIYALGN